MINPKVSTWINLAISILGFLVTASAVLTPVFGEGTTHTIVAVSGLVLGFLGAINTALHGVSAPVAGPLVK